MLRFAIHNILDNYKKIMTMNETNLLSGHLKDEWDKMEKLAKKAREICPKSALPAPNAFRTVNGFLMESPMHPDDVPKYCRFRFMRKISSVGVTDQELEEEISDSVEETKSNKPHCLPFPQLSNTRFRRMSEAVIVAISNYR